MISIDMGVDPSRSGRSLLAALFSCTTAFTLIACARVSMSVGITLMLTTSCATVALYAYTSGSNAGLISIDLSTRSASLASVDLRRVTCNSYLARVSRSSAVTSTTTGSLLP